MNTKRLRHLLVRLNLALVTLLLATFGTMFAAAPVTAAQVAPDLALALDYTDALNGGPSLFTVSPTAALHTPEGEFVGRDAVSAFRATLETSFANLRFTTTDVEQAGEAGAVVIISITFTGTNTGSYHGLPATCAAVSSSGVAVLRLGDAGVVEQWIGYDSDALASQVAAFGQWPALGSSGCTGQEPAALEPTSVPPVCTNAETCELPTW
jgi:predicted ester cyclase